MPALLAPYPTSIEQGAVDFARRAGTLELEGSHPFRAGAERQPKRIVITIRLSVRFQLMQMWIRIGNNLLSRGLTHGCNRESPGQNERKFPKSTGTRAILHPDSVSTVRFLSGNFRGPGVRAGVIPFL